MKKDLTEIIVIADRSASMSNTIEEARSSINRLIEEQKAEKGEANFTFVMFDDQYELARDRVSLKTIEPIGNEYEARGMTAMNDTIGKTVNSIGAQLAAEKEEDRPEKVIVAIVTDGQENASQEFTRAQVAEMLKVQQEEFNWEVIFFGADINTAQVGASLNILAVNSVDYDNTQFGVNTAYTTLSKRMSDIRNK